MLKVFVGDNTGYLSDFVKKIDPLAYLCTDKNYNTSLTGTIYTSLADLSINQLNELLMSADTVIYCPPALWSSKDLEEQTHIVLNFLHNKKEIKGFKKKQYSPEYFSIADTRKTEGKQIWLVGCSITQGYGLDKDEGYGYIVGKELNLPVSSLTATAASIKWSADQILRADIREDDLVIWGITAVGRYPFVRENDTLDHIMPYSHNENKEFKNLFSKNFLVSNHICYEAIASIEYATKYMNKNNIKSILGVFPLYIDKHKQKFLKYISQFNNSLILQTETGTKDRFVDFANDNCHPGVMQNRLYANSILDFYNNNQFLR